MAQGTRSAAVDIFADEEVDIFAIDGPEDGFAGEDIDLGDDTEAWIAEMLA